MRRLLDWLPALVALGVLIAALLMGAGGESDPGPQSRPTPKRPDPAPEPTPCPDDRCPKPRPRPWPAHFEATVGGPRHPDGTELDCDLPEPFHVKNRGGSDGAGLCVFASMRHSGLWADEPERTEAAFMRRAPDGNTDANRD